jgi:hypothetical protein
MAWALHLLGLAAHIAGEYPAVLAHYEQALAIWQDLGHAEGIGVCFNVVGFTACRQGDYATALAHARNGVRALREVPRTGWFTTPWRCSRRWPRYSASHGERHGWRVQSTPMASRPVSGQSPSSRGSSTQS